MDAVRLAVFAAFFLSIVVACGGPSPAASPRGPGTGQPVTQAPSAAGFASPSAALVASASPALATPVAPAGTPAAGTDLCALLSAEDLNAVTGQDYLAGLPDAYGQCVWDGDQMAHGGGGAGDTVVAAILPSDLAAIKTTFGSGGKDVVVSGHSAFYNPKQGLGSLWVDLGDGTLLVLSFPSSADLDPSYEAIAVQLAERALGNM